MTIRFKTLFFSLMTLAALATAAYFIFRPQEKKIKKQFKLLCEFISKGSGEKKLKMIYETQALAYLFYSDCDVELTKSPWNGTYSPEEISSQVARGKTHFKTIKLTIHDIKIEKIDTTTVRVLFTARLTAKSDSNAIDEVRELESTLILHEGRWLFSSFKNIDILEK